MKLREGWLPNLPFVSPTHSSNETKGHMVVVMQLELDLWYDDEEIVHREIMGRETTMRGGHHNRVKPHLCLMPCKQTRVRSSFALHDLCDTIWTW